jgi:outer membrane protein assembly factor BamA
LRADLTKISLILLTALFLYGCNAVKRVPDGKYLLTENSINVDGEEVTEFGVLSQLAQKPNPTIPLINFPLGLHIYNIAEPNPDSTFQDWLYRKPNRKRNLVKFLSEKQVIKLDSSKVGINNWLKETGDAPTIISDVRTKKSLERLKRYYASFGYFNTKATATVVPNEKKEKRAAVNYEVQRFKPYIVDSIQTDISSPVIDSLFRKTRSQTFLKSGVQYSANDLNNERDRLTIEFRNSGVYHFDQEYITFEGDTVKTVHKANMKYIIPDRKIEEGDSTRTAPFEIYSVNKVRIVTDFTFDNKDKTVFQDSAKYKGYELYSYDDLKFRPQAIADAVSIQPNAIFKDIDRTLTYNQISDLKIFKYPNISYQEDPTDSKGTGLIATILLTPREKYTLGADFDTYTSTIQQIGIGGSGSMFIRNIFKGAETLEISARGSIGSSNDVTDNSNFFNIFEFGGDVKLSFPRILSPFKTDKIIPKYMSPSTNVSTGFSSQKNIGLDRQTVNGVYNYSWKPSKVRKYRLDFFNVQFVRNVNPDNYFNVYRSSFERLNEIAQEVNYDFIDNGADPQLVLPADGTGFNEADFFTTGVLTGTLENLALTPDLFSEILSIRERQERLTENNLIFASNFTFLRDTRTNLFDKDFTRLRVKLESAGGILSLLSKGANLVTNTAGQKEIFGVAFSQYGKIETEITKHWELPNGSVVATRAFAGIAIPYGNSNSIPFTRSYFAGGANDNRGWRPYDLGPGSSGSILDFNEANFKVALNAEYRFTILGAFKGVFFVDAGNIWNIYDDVDVSEFKFDGIKDFKELAIATGTGVRYDFGFFVFRLDLGFKTHDPALAVGERWFKNFSLRESVLNIGINYPF